MVTINTPLINFNLDIETMFTFTTFHSRFDTLPAKVITLIIQYTAVLFDSVLSKPYAIAYHPITIVCLAFRNIYLSQKAQVDFVKGKRRLPVGKQTVSEQRRRRCPHDSCPTIRETLLFPDLYTIDAFFRLGLRRRNKGINLACFTYLCVDFVDYSCQKSL